APSADLRVAQRLDHDLGELLGDLDQGEAVRDLDRADGLAVDAGLVGDRADEVAGTQGVEPARADEQARDLEAVRARAALLRLAFVALVARRVALGRRSDERQVLLLALGFAFLVAGEVRQLDRRRGDVHRVVLTGEFG